MKKFTLAFAILLACGLPLMAQPTLTSSVMNPAPTEVFIGHQCDTTGGVTQGASGASVTWNFGLVSELGLDTTTWMSCGAYSFLHCDSFMGSNLVMFDNTDYFYCIADTSKLAVIGATNGSVYIHSLGEQLFLYYPLTYNSVKVDSYKYSIPPLRSYREIDSFICDGYGTLILPSATYTNAMRVHEISYVWDTTTGSPISIYRTENYNWYASGFRNILLSVTIDTTMPGGPFTSWVEYYTNGSPLGVLPVVNQMNMELYPNPAGNVVHAKFFLADKANASVTLTDMTGRTVTAIGSENMQTGNNELDIPVSGLPAGMYVVRISNGGQTAYKKIFVSN